MYDEIINEIRANLGENNELNKKYLSSQMEKYIDHPYNREILREISRMMWDCLSEEEQEEFTEIFEKENPVMDILNDVTPDIESGEYNTALDKLDSFIENYPATFEDDNVSEYHYFTNPLEELLFYKYICPEKVVRHIPDNTPLLDLYYIYGFLLLETNQFDKAEKYLKKAIGINPVSSRIILELCEIYKIHTYNYNKYYMHATDALKYAYLPQDIARCYRSLGYYYIEENQLEVAFALFRYSMEYEMNPMAYSEIRYIQNKNKNINLSLDESVEIIMNKNIQLGVNPFILETLDAFIKEYEENKLYIQTQYFLELKYNLTNDEKTAEKIENLNEMINY